MAGRAGTLRQRTQAALLLLLLAVAGHAIADERRSNVIVEIEHAPAATTSEALGSRLVAALCGNASAAAIRSAVGTRLRVTVSVRPVSATTLRGFWLPFSGIYGIGRLRLAVERMVSVPDLEGTVPAVVWQADRVVAGPWRHADQEIARVLDEMAAELRATGPKQQCTSARTEEGRPDGGHRFPGPRLRGEHAETPLAHGPELARARHG